MSKEENNLDFSIHSDSSSLNEDNESLENIDEINRNKSAKDIKSSGIVKIELNNNIIRNLEEKTSNISKNLDLLNNNIT